MISVAIGFLQQINLDGSTSAGYPFPTGQFTNAQSLLVSGFPLYFLINGLVDSTNLPTSGSFHSEIVWGNLAINILFWFFVIVGLAKTGDLLKKENK